MDSSKVRVVDNVAFAIVVVECTLTQRLAAEDITGNNEGVHAWWCASDDDDDKMSPIAAARAAYHDHRAAAVLEAVAPAPEHRAEALAEARAVHRDIVQRHRAAPHYRAAAVLEVDAPAPRHRFEERINALVGMGLLDRERNQQALDMFQGNMQLAIDLLLAADAD